MTTYQTIIRSYSSTVATGHSDTDLTRRQRRIVHVMLNLASNAARASIVYPPTDQARDDVVKHLAGILWDARPLVAAYAAASFDAPDFDVAIDRAFDILRAV